MRFSLRPLRNEKIHFTAEENGELRGGGGGGVTAAEWGEIADACTRAGYIEYRISERAEASWKDGISACTVWYLPNRRETRPEMAIARDAGILGVGFVFHRRRADFTIARARTRLSRRLIELPKRESSRQGARR